MRIGRASDEWVAFAQAPAVGGLEFVRARYVSHRFPTHAHAHYVIGAVVEGAKTTQHGGRSFTAGPGAAVLLNPYEEHASCAADGPWSWAAVYPSRALMQALFGPDDLAAKDGGVRFSAPMVQSGPIAQRMSDLHRALRTPGAALAGEGLLTALAAPFLAARIEGGRPAQERAHKVIGRVREQLDEDLAEDLRLTELAARAGLAPVALLRAFRSVVGCTPHAYRTARRLDAAKSALRRGHAPAEVAATVGFCDQSHLTRVFKRWVGSTPAAYVAMPLPEDRPNR